MFVTDIDVAEGVSADCAAAVNVTAQKGYKNCSNSDGWYGEIVDAAIGVAALVYPINGTDIMCYPFRIPQNSIHAYAFWPGMTYVRQSMFRGRPTNEYRLIAGRYYAPFFVDVATNAPVLFGQGIYGNIHMLVNAFVPDSVRGDDARFNFPAACGLAINELVKADMPSLSKHDIERATKGQQWAPADRLHQSAFDALSASAVATPAEHRRAVEEYHADVARFMPAFSQWPELTALIASGKLPAASDNRAFATSVRNQGRCGGCWSFSTTALTEVVLYMARGTPSNRTAVEWLAPQSKLDCVHGTMNNTALIASKGCQGGWPLAALAHTVEHGIATEQSYPFAYVTGARCKLGDAGVEVVKPLDSAFLLPNKNVSLMMAAVATYGAVVTIINPPNTWALFPGEGIFDDPTCVPGLEHAILIVGYGTDAATGKDYWVVKNSFGAQWSDAGYIRMVRGVNMCGIEDFAFGARPAPNV